MLLAAVLLPITVPGPLALSCFSESILSFSMQMYANMYKFLERHANFLLLFFFGIGMCRTLYQLRSISEINTVYIAFAFKVPFVLNFQHS